MDPGGGAEDQEPESGRPGSAPPKKPLAQFLAEFEKRLLDHPEESATTALQVVEDRAGGRRRSVMPGATTRAPASPIPVPRPASSSAPAPDLTPPTGVASPGPVAPPGTPGPQPEAEVPSAANGSEQPSAAETTAESRRLRGRRRRRHRHRAH